MKYNKIKSDLFVKNRKSFMKNMVGKSIAFFNSNDIYPISADSTLAFEQGSNFFATRYSITNTIFNITKKTTDYLAKGHITFSIYAMPSKKFIKKDGEFE